MNDAELQELKRQLQELRDKEAIREQISAYARAMDRIDTELAKTVFHRDSWAEYGDYKTNGWDFAEQGPNFQRTLPAYTHAMNNISIWIDDNSHARSECYAHNIIRRSLGEGQDQDEHIHVRYVDEWVKEDGRWQIMHRVMLSDLRWLNAPQPTSNDVTGSRDRNDPSYFPGR